MAKKPKEDLFEDLVLDPEDIEIIVDENITPIEATEAIEKAVKVVEEKERIPLTEEEEWKACITRLKKACDKSWICFPIATTDNLFLSITELHDATGKEFLEWLYYICPPMKTLGFTEKDCDTFSYRESIYKNVFDLLRLLHFPKNSMSI